MSDIKDLEGLEIFLGYKCNLRCLFCYQKDLRLKYLDNFSSQKIYSLLKKGRNQGKEFVIFSGGEPTLDKNLENYIKTANELGYKHIRVHTNGTGFGNLDYLLKLRNVGLSGVTVSIHGYGDIHDKIVGVKGSFEKITKSIINISLLQKTDRTFILDTNTVICKDNYTNIIKLIKFLSYFNVTRGQIVLAYSLVFFNKEEKFNIIPEYSQIIPYLEKIIYLSQKNNKKFVLENIPFCLVDDKIKFAITNNIKIQKESITIKEGNVGITDKFWVNKTDECKKCSFYDKCRGIPDEYRELYGIDFIKPITGIK